MQSGADGSAFSSWRDSAVKAIQRQGHFKIIGSCEERRSLSFSTFFFAKNPLDFSFAKRLQN